jgi:hypothetical protein
MYTIVAKGSSGETLATVEVATNAAASRMLQTLVAAIDETSIVAELLLEHDDYGQLERHVNMYMV